MINAAKELLQSDHQRRSRSRKRLPEKEWARFAIEYEASFPRGVSPPEDNDGLNIQTQNTVKPEVSATKSSVGSRKKTKPRKRPKTKQQKFESGKTPHVVIRLNPKDTQSILNKILPDRFLAKNNKEASDLSNGDKNASTSIQIDVIVDVVPDPDKRDENTEHNSSLSGTVLPHYFLMKKYLQIK